MGREVQCNCRWGGYSGAVKALLESDQIIVRGEISQRVSVAEVKHLRVDDLGLHFAAGRDQITLEMGATEAERWLKKIMRPQPSLRDKLGLSGETKAFVVGQVNDAALQEALDGFATTTGAKMVIAVAEDERQLVSATEAAKRLISGAAIWIVYKKGKHSDFGEARVRDGMRALEYVDTKIASVSATFTACRFLPKRK